VARQAVPTQFLPTHLSTQQGFPATRGYPH